MRSSSFIKREGMREMETGKTQTDLLRLIGVLAVCVGVAWAIQILGISSDATVVGRLLWTLAAASVCGAGVGLMVTAGSLSDAETVSVRV